MSSPTGHDNGPKQLVKYCWNPLVMPCDELRQCVGCCQRHPSSRNRDDRCLGRTCVDDILPRTGNPIDEGFLVLLVVEVGRSIRYCGIAQREKLLMLDSSSYCLPNPGGSWTVSMTQGDTS